MKIVVLLAAMTRGGIDLFQSLLDKHSQISQLPGKFYIDEFLKKIRLEQDNEKIALAFIKNYKEYFDSRLNLVERHDQLGPNKNEFYKVDEENFVKNFIELSKNKIVSKEEIIINLHLAYSASSGEDIKKKKLIILQIHHFFRIDSIKELNFEIICTIRNPLASHSSYVKNLSIFNNKSINPWQYYYHMERNFSHLINLCELKKNISVIKLERLHRNNQEVMSNLCQRFNINFEETLNKSTFQGKQWWGDQVSKKNLEGINKNFVNKIDDSSFYKNDIVVIEYFLNNFFKSYRYSFRDYQLNMPNIKKYLPLKVDMIILLQSLKTLNLKNFLTCIFYYFKRLKLMNKEKLDKFQYPKDL